LENEKALVLRKSDTIKEHQQEKTLIAAGDLFQGPKHRCRRRGHVPQKFGEKYFSGYYKIWALFGQKSCKIRDFC